MSTRDGLKTSKSPTRSGGPRRAPHLLHRTGSGSQSSGYRRGEKREHREEFSGRGPPAWILHFGKEQREAHPGRKHHAPPAAPWFVRFTLADRVDTIHHVAPD